MTEPVEATAAPAAVPTTEPAKPEAATTAVVETPIEAPATETVPVVPDVAVEALRRSYQAKLDSLTGKVSPANIGKLGALFTTGILDNVIFDSAMAGLIEAFLAVLSESTPIVATGDAKTLPDASKASANPVGDWVDKEFPA